MSDTEFELASQQARQAFIYGNADTAIDSILKILQAQHTQIQLLKQQMLTMHKVEIRNRMG